MELAARLARLYAAELARSLEPPMNPHVNRRQTAAIKHHADKEGAGVLRTADEKMWIWSDLHLGHSVAIMALDRPFRNTAQMDAALFDAWRENVAGDDTIVCLGDVSAEGDMHLGHEQVWNAAPGRKRLVLGNHDVDLANRIGALEIDSAAVALVAPGDPDLLLTHVPLVQIPHGCVNVHGHVHGHVHDKSSPTRNRHINASVEQLDYRPVRMTDGRGLARRLLERGDVAGETTAQGTAELVRSGELEEPPEGPPRLVHRVGNGRERWHAEANLACPPGRRPGTRGPVRQVEEPRSAQGWVALAAASRGDDRKRIDEAIAAAERVEGTTECFDARGWAQGCGAGRRAIAEALLACRQAAGGIAVIDNGDAAVHRDNLEAWWTALIETVAGHDVQVLFSTHRQKTVRAAADACIRADVECAVQSLWRREDGSRACATFHGETLRGAFELGLRLV